MLKKVVFLDRDGTINRDSPDYIKSREEFEFLPGSLEAINNLTHHGFVIIVVTNQSAVPRKLISLIELEFVHNMMALTVALNGGEIKDVFYCPHMPEDGCDCRKPEPGLIFQARKKYEIDLTAAVMVGDSAKDIECARRAGCGHAVLVKSGQKDDVEAELKSRQIRVDYVAKDLYEAAEWVIKNHS
ncbi:MAG: D-glycero-beta-D-manno-heptose 1,7-bisphosphate 7-phosphatase [Deltaproteobacteria bacterium]|nr:D-glycero-beta-D-manno-heptose 1,7-bisphosphate 7-phosphatase [Deltaproteobacteria bacterium]